MFLIRTSPCFKVLGAGLEPAQPLWSQDFKSCVSTIHPSRPGAEDGTRTRDPDLGKVVLYQLSYFRNKFT